MAAPEDEGLALVLDRSVDVPSLVMMDQRGSETVYIMGLAFADEDESPSPRRSFGKESPNLQELPARAWGKEVHTGRLSHVVIAVDARANNKWRRTKPQKGVKGLVRRLGSSSSKAWKKCFRPCMDIDSERAIDLGNLNSDDMLKESVPVLFKDDSPGLQEQAMRALLHLSGIYGNPLKIVSFPKAVEGVVRLLLRDDEPNLQRLATLTLGNLALRQVSAVASVAMEGLARLLFEKEGRSLELSIQLQEEAASVLANICYAPEGGRKVMNPWTDALAGLIKLLFMNDRKGAQEEATRALVNLALVQENAQKLLEFPTVSVIGGLVGLLTDYERPAVLDNATRALASLSYAPQNARKIAESEHFGRALQGLVGMLMRRRRKDATLQELAVMTLANLSITSEIQIQIADFPNVLPEMLSCLTQSNDHSVVEHAAMAMGNLAIAQENRPKIANYSGMLRALVDVMADNKNPGGQEHAAYALSNLSHAHEWNQLKIADVPGVMKGVVHLLTMEASPSSQEQAARLLANLTYPQENSAKIITYPNALTGLAALLAKHENINLQREVTRAFANLTCSRDNRWISAFCTEGLARVLVTYSARRYAASSVEIVEIPEATIPRPEKKLSMLPALEYRTNEEGENGHPVGDMEEMMEVRMLDVAAIEGVKTAEQGLAALALESQAPSKRREGKVLVVEEDLPRSTRLEVAPEAMTVEQHIPEKTTVTAQPTAIAKDENEHETDEHHMEVKMLDVASVEHAQAATITEKRVLSDLEKNERISRIENISKKLSRLAMHPDQESMETLPDLTAPVVDETDTNICSAKGKDQQQQTEIDLEMEHLAEVDEGGLTLEQARPLLPEYRGREEENELRTREVENLILEQASIALGNLAIHKENKRIIGECEDALSGLLGLLPRYDSPAVQENAAWALANLFHEEDGSDVVDTIAELKGPRAIQSLGELLLDNEIPLVQEQATRALANLAYFPENQAEIIELPKALSGVVGLMSNDENPGIQEKAVRLLTNLTCAKEYWTTIAEFPGVVPGLSDLLAKEQNPDIQRTAAMCLSNLALAPENIPTLVESPSAMASVVELLSNDENPAAQEQAAKFIVNVAASQDTTHQLRISEFPRILPELEKFLFQDESPGVQEQAIKAIVNLARNPENKQKVIEEPDALSGIARMLSKDDNSVVQLNGALAFKNLSLEISSLQKLVDCPNVLAGLVRLLSRHGDYAQEAAVLTLLNLSRLRNIAIDIAKYDYPKALIDLAMLLRMSDNKLVVESTAMILTNLANAPENRQLMADVPEVGKGLEWLLSDCALEEQLLMTAMSDSQKMVMSDAEGELDEARSFDNKESLKGQRTGTGFWAATALTLIDLPRARGLTLHSGEAYKGRGNAMIWMGLVKEAIEEFDVSTQLQPEAPGTFSLRGIAKSLLQDYEAALIDADRGIELDPQYGGWYQERGILKRIMGDLAGALADLNKAVELEKDDYEMLKHRGYVRFLLHDEEGAREDAEWALRVQDLSATLDESQYHDYIMSFLGALPVEYLDYKLR